MKQEYQQVTIPEAYEMMDKQPVYKYMPSYMGIGGKMARICGVEGKTTYYYFEI